MDEKENLSLPMDVKVKQETAVAGAVKVESPMALDHKSAIVKVDADIVPPTLRSPATTNAAATMAASSRKKRRSTRELELLKQNQESLDGSNWVPKAQRSTRRPAVTAPTSVVATAEPPSTPVARESEATAKPALNRAPTYGVMSSQSPSSPETQPLVAVPPKRAVRNQVLGNDDDAEMESDADSDFVASPVATAAAVAAAAAAVTTLTTVRQPTLVNVESQSAPLTELEKDVIALQADHAHLDGKHWQGSRGMRTA
jgi:hypothetical protein